MQLLHISSSPVDWFVSSLLKPIINGQPLVKQKEEEQSVGSPKKKECHATVIRGSWEKKGTFDLKCLENKYTTNLENANPPGEVLNKCLYGEARRCRSTTALRSRSNSLPLAFTYHFLRKPFRKRYPFRIPSIDKWYPFHIPCFELCIPFNCCADTLSFKQVSITKIERFLRFR